MSTARAFLGLDASQPTLDDRVLPLTRWVGRVLVPVLAVASLILFGFPDRTTELFAWTIRPAMTPLVMGAGYATGAYFFYRVATTDRWHTVALVFPGIVCFAWFMGLATALHWANFNHGHVTFAIWTFLYAVAPLLVPAIWLLNRRTDPHTDGGRRLPTPIRWAGISSGLLITVTALFLFVVPESLLTYWVWDVSPLTARVLLGWFVLFGVVNLTVGLDARWSASRIPLQTQLLGFGLLFVGVVRSWGDFDASNPLTWLFLGGLGTYALAILVLYYGMERNRSLPVV